MGARDLKNKPSLLHRSKETVRLTRDIDRVTFGQTCFDGFTKAESKTIEALFNQSQYGVNPQLADCFRMAVEPGRVGLKGHYNLEPFDTLVSTHSGTVYGECGRLTSWAYQRLKPLFEERYTVNYMRGWSDQCFNDRCFQHYFLGLQPKLGDKKAIRIIDPALKRAGLLTGAMKGYHLDKPRPIDPKLDQARQETLWLQYGQYLCLGFVDDLIPSRRSAKPNCDLVLLGFSNHGRVKGIPANYPIPIVMIIRETDAKDNVVEPITPAWIDVYLKPTDPLTACAKAWLDPSRYTTGSTQPPNEIKTD